MKKMLVVEDDLTSSMLLQEILKRYGPVDVAVNGKEGLEKVRFAINTGQPFDLICMDIMMPEMDGYEALEKIRALEESKGIPVADGARIFMISALGDVSNVLHAFNGSCDAYLLKPIERETLLERMREFVLTRV